MKPGVMAKTKPQVISIKHCGNSESDKTNLPSFCVWEPDRFLWDQRIHKEPVGKNHHLTVYTKWISPHCTNLNIVWPVLFALRSHFKFAISVNMFQCTVTEDVYHNSNPI